VSQSLELRLYQKSPNRRCSPYESAPGYAPLYRLTRYYIQAPNFSLVSQLADMSQVLSSWMNSGDYIPHDYRLSMVTTLKFYLILSLELVDVALAVLEAPAGPIAVPVAVRVEVVIKEEMAAVPYATLEERVSSIYFDVILWWTRRREGRGIRKKTNQVALAAV